MASILSTIMGVESGGRNVTQGNIGDINNVNGTLAQGYFQITNPTWAQFGGLGTGYSSALDAPYSVQAQVAQNIPVARWGPNTQSALRAAGYFASPGQTLGQLMGQYGQSASGTLPGPAGSILGGGKTGIFSMADIGATPASGGSPVTPGSNTGGATPASGGSAATPGNTGTGAPVVITDITSAGSSGLTTLNKGVKTSATTVAQGIDTAAASINTANTGIVNSVLTGVEDWFLRGGLGILGALLIIGGVYLMAKEQTA